MISQAWGDCRLVLDNTGIRQTHNAAPTFELPESTRRVYRLYDFTKSQTITSDHFYCVSGKVNSADKLYLVIESVKRDAKHGAAVTTGVGRRGSEAMN